MIKQREPLGITAAILAGGLGTRLHSVVADQPKVLAKVQGRPFLAYLLDQLGAARFRDVVLCTGYLGEQVRAVFGDSYSNLHLTYSKESTPLGTAGALRLALPLFKVALVLVMNGDSFCQADLSALWTWHYERGAAATILLTEMLDAVRYGQVRVESDGRVRSFTEKGEGGGSGWINAGIYLIGRDLLYTIPVGRAVSIEKEMFPAWIDRGLYGHQGKGRFLDIGVPESYALADNFFADEKP